MNILGINAYHGDSSAALIQDGVLIAAVEEERFTRIKHWAGFPVNSIRYCLQKGNVQAAEIDHVTVSFNPKAHLKEKLLFTLKHRPALRTIISRLLRQKKSLDLKTNLSQALNCQEKELKAQFHFIGHHESHIGSSFLLSPYDSAAILSLDGMGDFTSCVMSSGEGSKINTNYFSKIFHPHSLGFLYNAITIYLGFPNYGDEYKVMGLAPYGEPEFVDEFRKMFFLTKEGFKLNLDYFEHHKKGIKMAWDGGLPKVESFHSQYLEKRLGAAKKPREQTTKREENIAASLQKVTEEVIMHLLNILYGKFPSKNLCFAGGVAMNSVANGKIHKETPFKNIFVPVGAADNGTAFGSAFYLWNQILGNKRSFELKHAYWGSEYGVQECKLACDNHGVKYKILEEDLLVEQAVEAMIQGKVVGWYQGRMELGARALGNRSLIADPRREDMRDIINLRIKFREKFRPFAPSILKEKVGEYFEDDVNSPFMEKVIPIKKEKRPIIPAVTHVDGTGRLQTVEKETNPLYYKLIKKFEEKTGIPIVLNTSLNENEPIVCTPDETINCFLRTKMDCLALGNCFIVRDKD